MQSRTPPLCVTGEGRELLERIAAACFSGPAKETLIYPPLAVILVVPLGVLGVVLGTDLFGLSNDVYFKVGLITIIGLSAKNAILIIEFAKDLQAEGKGLIEATLAACHLRFRPIIMTSFAFILGVLPLALASGPATWPDFARLGPLPLTAAVACALLCLCLRPRLPLW